MPITPEQAKKNGKKGGRPKGKKSAKTLEREKVLDLFNQRALKMANKLLNAQAIVALGTHKMVVMAKVDGIVSVETIRDEKKMQKLLDTGEYGNDYLIVAASEPDWKAADAILNRALGKPKETVDHKGKITLSFDKTFDDSSDPA